MVVASKHLPMLSIVCFIPPKTGFILRSVLAGMVFRTLGMSTCHVSVRYLTLCCYWYSWIRTCCCILAYERGSMSEWDYIQHHLDITSAALHGESDCCSTSPTNFNGPAVQQPLSPNDTAIRCQDIINLTCRDSGQ